MFLIIVLAVRPICGTNEKWDSCHGECEPTCEEPKKNCSGCIKGCFCRSGYVRNNHDKCVLPSDCPKRKVHHGKYYNNI